MISLRMGHIKDEGQWVGIVVSPIIIIIVFVGSTRYPRGRVQPNRGQGAHRHIKYRDNAE